MNTRTLINNNLPDVQSSADPRNIDIEYVGVKGIELPVTVESADGVQHTIAQIGMFVALPAEHKGTHMSRFLGLLKEHDRPLNKSNLISLMHDMLVSLESSAGRIDFTFPFFVKKQAPVSKLESLMNYQVHLCVEHKNTETWVTQTVTVPVTSLCPCSKEISAYGAHNQRSHVTIAAKLKSSQGNRILAAEWHTRRTMAFAATIQVKGIDDLGLINEITQIISRQLNVNIHKLCIESNEGIFEGQIELYVFDVEDVKTLCNSLRQVKNIQSVTRV